jgi:hypothetical protein
MINPDWGEFTIFQENLSEFRLRIEQFIAQMTYMKMEMIVNRSQA